MTEESGRLRHCGCGEEIYFSPLDQQYRHAEERLDRHHTAMLQTDIFDQLDKG